MCRPLRVHPRAGSPGWLWGDKGRCTAASLRTLRVWRWTCRGQRRCDDDHELCSCRRRRRLHGRHGLFQLRQLRPVDAAPAPTESLTAVRLTDRLSALTDIRTENARAPRPYGLYLRFKPFETRDVDIQAGRIPPVFGAYTRRVYSTDNLLISFPLAYQYLTSLRPDAVPATADDLIRMRGRGWLSSFPIGEAKPAAGLPLVNALRWDTGVQVHAGTAWLEGSASVTTGSLANPLVLDDNRGRNLSGRLALKPVAGLTLGTSAARAPYATSAAAAAAHATDDAFVQTAFSFDAEYSRDHYLAHVETIVSRYNLPTLSSPLRATSAMVEGRYKFTPRLHAAARLDHLAFSRISGSVRTTTWDAPVTRWEVGTGYSFQRNLQLRVSFQRNTRDGGRVQRLSAAATQLLYWF